MPAEGPKPGVAKHVIVCESPGKTEEAMARPLVGQSGAIVNDALVYLGAKRSECYLTNAIKCRPHKGITAGEWNLAEECCRPMLQVELKDATKIVAMGAHALRTLTAKNGIKAWEGWPLEGSEDLGFGHLTVFPFGHPAALFRNPAELPRWLTNFQRGLAFSSGALGAWQWPKRIIEEGKELEEFLAYVEHEKPTIALDVETAGEDPFTSKLTCVGIATLDVAASFDWPLASSVADACIRRILESAEIPKVLQNGNYDWVALEANGITLRGFVWDTLYAACIITPQIEKNLGAQASIFVGGPRWKTHFRVYSDAKGAARFNDADPEELKTYNAGDNYMTLRLYEEQRRLLPLIHKADTRMAELMELGKLAKKMKCRGMLVDSAAREKHRTALREEVAEAEKRFYGIIGRELNWQSPPQLHDLFWRELNCPATQFDKETGKPKLDGAALADLIAAYGRETAGAAASALHRLRERSKLLQTYVEELPVAQWDGCVHPWWKFFTVTGRWNCDSPNMQNVPKPVIEKLPDGSKRTKRPGMRDMFVSRPGFWLVEADYSQLELRILALLSGDRPLLEAYARGEDVHQLNACALFDVREASKHQRDFAKRFVYGLNYGGTDKTIHKALVVLYPDLTLEQVGEMRRRWELAHPQIAVWQKQQIINARELKHVEAPLSGRRYRFYLGRVEPTICFNYPMQSTGADIVNRATLALDRRLVATGLGHILLQVHDALVVETEDVTGTAALMKEVMSVDVELNGASMRFPVDIQTGTDWGHMKELHV